MSTVTEYAGQRKIGGGRSLIEASAEYPAGELVKTIETGNIKRIFATARKYISVCFLFMYPTTGYISFISLHVHDTAPKEVLG